MNNIKNKVVLITGASSGIGARTAVLFAKCGARLALHGRNAANLEKVADECVRSGLQKNKILLVTGNFRNEEDIRRIMEETINCFKTLDVLINNAGTCIVANIQQITMAQFDDLMNVNVRAMVLLTKLAIPHLKASKGSIVNVSSNGSLRGSVCMGAYCMTKASVDMFTTVLALELGGSGVRVNSVNPGEIRTSIQTRMGIKDHQLDRFYEDAGETHPLGRCGFPDEVASAILYLASEAASFITGACLPVDGGQSRTASWFFQEMDGLANQGDSKCVVT